MPDDPYKEAKAVSCPICHAAKSERCRNEDGEEHNGIHAGRLSGGGPLKVRRVDPGDEGSHDSSER